ncbi:Small-conductance mechanosensitive channel [Pseudomonas delhiensis]|uniref:Small-conductance mechanosensitive channel n=1 Tax=Pseudomonas delhiensis TaxID=366289 RepID=A0A239MGZ7_9PSED|nr:DUF3772 domain-containing protein [Pseudomonas delhiensis]SDJ64348.1 Small-conductance mechanosensitive channel [Pseudomonas delhiensis]SNT41941.1 Small-conductance mechanosensitive channel [Pseudomonas delhiensis]
MSGDRKILLRCLLILSLFCAGWALAAPAPQVPAELPVLAEDAGLPALAERLESIRQGVSDQVGDDDLARLRLATLDVQKLAGQHGEELQARLDRLSDQLNVLGPPAEGEAAALAVQRVELSRQKAELQAQATQAADILRSAQDLAAQIVNLRRSLFNSQIAMRSPPPFSPTFWSTLTRPTDDDLARLRNLGDRFGAGLAATWRDARLALLVCLVAAALLWTPGRRLLERFASYLVSRFIPEGRLRRSSLALATTLASVVTLGGAAALARQGLDWNGSLDNGLAALADQMVTLAVFSAFITGLGRALLMVRRPSWRLLPIPDQAAQAVAHFPGLLAIVVMLLGAQDRINSSIGASLALTVAVNGLTALLIAVLFGIALLRLRRSGEEDEEHPRPALAGVIHFAALLVVALIVLALLSGYLSLAFFLATKLLWVSAVAVIGYLLTAFFGDLCDTLLSPRQAAGKTLARALGLAPQHQAQAATLLAGVGRTLLVLMTLMVVLSPTASSPDELLAGVERLAQGGQALGNLNIVPQDILLALLTLLGGLFALRLLKRWLAEELLPETSMDAGMRASLVTLVGYLGFVLLGLLTLSALRINLTSLTWVVSALSVGIGFGLQAIVQNFISGLILLTERPVKVGDWVSLSGVEGDIRRINVRATEIQQADNSTVIVPNSQMITQNVRNVTMGGALGSVGISLTLPLDTDVHKVRELMLAAYAEHPAILETPRPSVSFTQLTDQGLTLAASGSVSSPRGVSAARSDLLFSIFGKLRAEGINLVAPRSLRLVGDGKGLVEEPAAGGSGEEPKSPSSP